MDPAPSRAGFPIPKVVGTIFMVIGAFVIIYHVLFKKTLIPVVGSNILSGVAMMCPNYRQPVWGKKFPVLMCPKCNIEAENVDVFYTRHPELRPEINSMRKKLKLRN